MQIVLKSSSSTEDIVNKESGKVLPYILIIILNMS